jgi:hypothetical protein
MKKLVTSSISLLAWLLGAAASTDATATKSTDTAIQDTGAKELSSLISGVWQGDAVQELIARREINLMVEFCDDKSCSIVLSTDTFFTGLDITKVTDRVHLLGSWEELDGAIFAIMRQTEWKQEIQEFNGYGQSTPVEKAQRKLSEFEFLFSFDYDPSKGIITYNQITNKNRGKKTIVTSGDGASLLIMIPVEMKKIENPLPDGNQ